MRTAFVIAFAALAAIILAAWLWERVSLRQATSTGWPVPSGDLASIPTLYPPHDDNDAGRRIAAFPMNGPANVLQDYVTNAAAQAHSNPQPPPAVIAPFLNQNAGRLDEIEDALQTAIPAWRLDIRDPDTAPSPPLGACVTLVRLLIAVALDRAAHDDMAGAWHALRAASRIPEGLLVRPEVMSETVAMVLAKFVLGAMRQIRGAPPSWALRWPEGDLTQSLAHALTADAWRFEKEWSTALQRESSPTMTVYARIGIANTLTRDRVALQRLFRSSSCDQHRVDDPPAPPKWNVFGMVAFLQQNLAPALMRLHRLNADIEGTRLLLAAREVRAATGAWPANEPAVASPCAPHLWSCTTDASGDLRLNARAPLLKPGYPTLTLSESFVEH